MNDGVICNFSQGDTYAATAWLARNYPKARIETRIVLIEGEKEIPLPEIALFQTDGDKLEITDCKTLETDSRGFYRVPAKGPICPPDCGTGGD